MTQKEVKVKDLIVRVSTSVDVSFQMKVRRRSSRDLGISYREVHVTTKRPYTGTLTGEARVEDSRSRAATYPDGMTAFPPHAHPRGGYYVFGLDLTRSNASAPGVTAAKSVQYEFRDVRVDETFLVLRGDKLEDVLWPVTPDPLTECLERWGPLRQKVNILVGPVAVRTQLHALMKWLEKIGLDRLVWPWGFFGWTRADLEKRGTQNMGPRWREAAPGFFERFESDPLRTVPVLYTMCVTEDPNLQPEEVFESSQLAHGVDGRPRTAFGARRVINELGRRDAQLADARGLKEVWKNSCPRAQGPRGWFCDVVAAGPPSEPHGGLTTDLHGLKTLREVIAERNQTFRELGELMGPVLSEGSFTQNGNWNPDRSHEYLYSLAGSQRAYNIARSPSEEGEVVPHYAWHIGNWLRCDHPGPPNRFFPTSFQPPFSRAELDKWRAWAMAHGRQLSLSANGPDPQWQSQRDTVREICLGAFYHRICAPPARVESIGYLQGDSWVEWDEVSAEHRRRPTLRIAFESGDLLYVNMGPAGFQVPEAEVQMGLNSALVLGSSAGVMVGANIALGVQVPRMSSYFDAVFAPGFRMIDGQDKLEKWGSVELPLRKLVVQNSEGPNLCCDEQDRIVVTS